MAHAITDLSEGHRFWSDARRRHAQACGNLPAPEIITAAFALSRRSAKEWRCRELILVSSCEGLPTRVLLKGISGRLGDALRILAAAGDTNVDRDAPTNALGDDTKIFVKRLAAVEPALIGSAETGCQLHVDPLDPQSS
jgi:hypothetical protein